MTANPHCAIGCGAFLAQPSRAGVSEAYVPSPAVLHSLVYTSRGLLARDAWAEPALLQVFISLRRRFTYTLAQATHEPR